MIAHSRRGARSRRIPGALIALLAFGPACAKKPEAPSPSAQAGSETPPPAQPKPPKLGPRAQLPLVVREALSASMERHGEELTFLLAGVVLLHYDDVVELAQLIADEPKLGRPLPGDQDTLNALLPTAFFDYQDALTARARALADAAREKDPEKVGSLLGALAETCVGCHAAYLEGELEAVPSASEPTPNGD